VHGTTADHTRWDTVRPLFEPHVGVAALDRRGRGATGDADVYAFEGEVDDVVAVVDALARESDGPVDLLGHSYGGLCALGAVLRTESVRRLVIYEAPVLGEGVVPDGFLDRVAPLVEAGRFDEVLMAFFREVVHMPEDQLRAFRELPAWEGRLGAAPTIARELETASGRPLRPEQLAACALPTLLVAGGDSPEFLRRSTDALAAALPDVRVAVLAGQQHAAMDTAPQLFADAVLGFLTEG
jgi:pimeloyl-ACP methyl ester carboxylesterase